jgi:hypothetical protein
MAIGTSHVSVPAILALLGAGRFGGATEWQIFPINVEQCSAVVLP